MKGVPDKDSAGDDMAAGNGGGGRRPELDRRHDAQIGHNRNLLRPQRLARGQRCVMGAGGLFVESAKATARVHEGTGARVPEALDGVSDAPVSAHKVHPRRGGCRT